MLNTLSPYECYENRPRILDFTEREISDKDTLMPTTGGYFFIPRRSQGLLFRVKKIKNEDIVDLAAPAGADLLEKLTPGTWLAEKLSAEIKGFKKDPVLVFYPKTNKLVKFAPAFWHRLVLVISNSHLLRDPEMKLKWQEIRECFERAVIAVAGGSVGNGVIHSVVQDLRPAHVKIADLKEFHLANANRVRLTYDDFARNKAVVAAEQIHSLDPFIRISVYPKGVNEDNIEDFIAGNLFGEPRAAIVIEETDDPGIKLFIREYARARKIPLLMATDLGSAVQLDVRRFDVNPSMPLVPGNVSDERLFETQEGWQKDRQNLNRFSDFVSAIAGDYHLRIPELRRIIAAEDEVLFRSIPQLGSTAMMAGAMAAEAAARILLGHKLPERMFFNKHTGEVKTEGERL